MFSWIMLSANQWKHCPILKKGFFDLTVPYLKLGTNSHSLSLNLCPISMVQCGDCLSLYKRRIAASKAPLQELHIPFPITSNSDR
ncbi:hypothetical protein KKA86_04510 [bacterium]|nr:hypothetical protein [bacterium]